MWSLGRGSGCWDNVHVADLPPGDPASPGGTLPAAALQGLAGRPFGVYVHVPFCATRCGYCDFNTYTPGELGSSSSPSTWLQALRRELDLAATMLKTPVPADTVFIGGGTPSLLGAGGLAAVLDAIRGSLGLVQGVEVTTEANPESTSPEFFAGIAAAGYTRVSLGMQSVAPHVLAVLDRVHTPGWPVAAAAQARAAGIKQVNLDLIYGTPGETRDDLAASLDAVLAAGVDHISAYALVVEAGTALARRVARGELPGPDDDVLAERYEQLDEALSAAGLHWYEVSNWATSTESRCRHNLGYWASANWWGAGPGAHSHVGGVRWWNVKHPARYAAALESGSSPAAGREVLSPAEQYTERVMLGLRLADGLPLATLDPLGRVAADRAVTEGLLTVTPGDRLVLTRRGRLLADTVVRDLLASCPRRFG
ncbi:MAG: radical SAM family heme chaperone HemW [Actinomycetota bacterium]|nr:radical SAM family heme chaperone HemW [Actinomycetota bacterium]